MASGRFEAGLKGLSLSLLIGLALISGRWRASAQAGCTPPSGNPIICENQQTGSDAWKLLRSGFQVSDDTNQQIKGYASATSINKGETINFHVSVNPAQTYSLDVYRLGWYQGKGGRLLQHIGPLNGIRQTTCPVDSSTGLIECNWSSGYTLTVPTTWTSGVYLGLLTNAAGFQNYITFVVRDDARSARLLYQQSVTTYQAYNNYPSDGVRGKSLYDFNSYGASTVVGSPRAAKVSFNRPYSGEGGDLSLVWEQYFIRWLERSGYDVSYSTNLDTHARGDRLLNYTGFLSVGHDEYWSKQMFDAVETARNSGVNLGFFGANDIYWQVRFEPSSVTGAADRTMVGYKSASADPVKGSTSTVLWRDPQVNRAEQGLLGVQFTSYFNSTQPQTHFPYVVTSSSHWIYEGTGFQNGDSVPGMVGYEVDRKIAGFALPTAVNNSHMLLSQSPIVTVDGSADYANSSIYQSPSGAWVFAAGTIAWSWGLDMPGVADSRIQRTTANILNRFTNGTLPAAPTGLSANTASTSQINLSWTDNSSDETSFVLERSLSSTFASVTTVTLPAGQTTYSDTGLAGSTTFYYRVKALSAVGSSPYSQTASASTSGGGGQPPPVGSILDGGDSNFLDGSLVTTTTAGQVTSMSVYVGPVDAATANRKFQMAIYTDSASRPASLLATSAVGTLTANSWNTVSITASLQASTKYWLVYNTNGLSGSVNNMYYDVAAMGTGVYSTGTVTYGTWPSTFPSSTLTTAKYSVFASMAFTDSTPPVRSSGTPAAPLPGGTTQTTIGLTTNEAATCRYGTAANQPYSSLTPMTTTGGTLHSTVVGGLSSGTTTNFRVRCQDAAGNANTDDFVIAVTVLVADGTPPTVTLNSPGATVAGTVTLAATASDNIGVARVEFWADGTLLLGTDTTSPYTMAFDTTTLANGSHQLTARAYDAVPNMGTSSGVNVTFANVVATPAISPSGGTFAGSVQVTLSTATSGAAIRYTTNGTTPTQSSQLYSSPFTLTSSATVKVVAFKAGLTDSALASATFTVTAPPPTLGLTTIGGTLDGWDSNYLNGSAVTATAGGQITSMSVYIGTIDASSSNRLFQLAIYTDVAGRPGTLVASSSSATLAANSWNVATISATLQSNAKYWLIYNTNGASGLVNNMYYNASSAGIGVYSNGPVSFGTWPATFPASTLTTAQYSVFARFGP